MGEPMGTVDGAWFRMDQAASTADVVSLLTFRELPPVARVRQLVEERILPCLRFRERAVRGAWPSRDRWEPDPSFSLDEHVTEVQLPGGGTEALRAFVGEVATRSLDPQRPLWRIHLVQGPNVAAIVAKIHHCLADGFALVALLLSLADAQEARPVSSHSLAAYRRLRPWLAPAELLRDALRSPRRAAEIGVEAAAMAVSFGRMMLLSAQHHPSLTPPLSGQRHVAWSRGLSLRDVREAALRHGSTLNDVILAAVAGALRSHLSIAGEAADAEPVRALVPVNLRPGLPDPRQESLGNRFGLVFLDLPTDLDSPLARLDAVHSRMQVAKSRPDALVSFGVLAAMGMVPPLVPAAASFFARKASVIVTNVPGPRAHLHVAGERVENAMFWVPHTGSVGLGISVLTYAGEVRIGVRADEAVTRRPEAIVDRFEREIASLGSDEAGAPAGATAPAASGTPSP